MPSPFARFLSLALLVFALFLPYAVTRHTYPIPTFYSEFTALALYLLLGAGVLFAASSTRARNVYASPAVALVPLAFGLLLVAQTFLLPVTQPSMNWLGAGFLLAAFMATHAGYGLARLNLSEDALRWASRALIVGGLWAVFAQVVQLFHAESHFSSLIVAYNITVERRPFGNMAQANHMATVIAFGMAGAMFLAQTRRLNVLAWAAVSAALAVGQALTVSRGPWLQTAVIVVAGFWMAAADSYRHRGVRHRYREWLIPLALVVIFLVVNVAVRWANVRYHLGLAVSAADRFTEQGQIAPRLALWKYGWTMFKAQPLLGVGWGEFPHYQLELVRALGGVEIANNSHNIFIDLLAKSGVVGLGILTVGLVAWLVRVLIVPHTAARVFGLTLIGVLLTHALVEYPQQYMFFLLPAMLIFGMLETKPLRFVPSGVSFGLQAVLVVVGLAALYPIHRDYARAEVLYYGAHPAQDYRADPSSLFRAWGEYGLATLLPINGQDLPMKLSMVEQAISLLPGETVLRRYAVLQALDGKQDAAYDTVERLRIFAEELHDWPSQLASLLELVNDEPKLAAFKVELLKKYGTPPQNAGQNDDEDD